MRTLFGLVFFLFSRFIIFSQVEFNSQDPNFFKFYGAQNVPIHTSYKEALKNGATVIKLNVRQEPIGRSIDKIDKLINTQILYLENNNILQLPNQIGKLNNLFILVSKDNPLRYISPKIADCSSLIYLELWNTHLDSLPNELQYLPNIELLRLLGNQSQDTLHISDSLKRMPRLSTIQFVDVDLFKFPQFILRSKKIENIYLVNCKIDSLPEDIFYLDKIKELNMEGNRIEVLPDALRKLNHLSFLNLKNNKLTTIDERMANIPSLQVLDISGNMIPLAELDILRVLFKRKGKILYSDYEKLRLEWLEEEKKKTEEK